MSCVSPSKIHVQGFIKGVGNWDPKNIIHLIIAWLNLKFSVFLGRRDAPISPHFIDAQIEPPSHVHHPQVKNPV